MPAAPRRRVQLGRGQAWGVAAAWAGGGLAAARLEGLVPLERRAICTGEAYRGVIRQELPEYADGQILGEPTGRDTVNAVGFAAAVFQKQDPDAVFAVLTADHLIEPREGF